ncbi:hypothetical protein Q3A66_08070 [Hymenobacter sp. BT770]|uniref:WapI family immunity protein n=1 Tax=Hymenobacter sp. BT770 TaxID=2886942 RepID=UPI001D1196F8|nr:hypothetical protein [Hymenobacter sp. BT770]MCC3153063.1 hypothetical protein [Hymenobacter sp. BT770]MDO3415024.1 hypothetical protein [Hymenobacter sp. BT770]
MVVFADSNHSVVLQTVNYQFPQAGIGGDWNWDANFLDIALEVKSEIGNWSIIDPCLTTWDLGLLAKWFSDLSQNQSVNTELGFIEPNLSWELVSSDETKKIIRMHFDLECRPPNALDEEVFLDFSFDDSDLEKISRAFLSELNKFPKR